LGVRKKSRELWKRERHAKANARATTLPRPRTERFVANQSDGRPTTLVVSPRCQLPRLEMRLLQLDRK
jgi:hypothetical protein